MLSVIVGERDSRTDRKINQIIGESDPADLDFIRLDAAEVELGEIEAAASALSFGGERRRVLVKGAPVTGSKKTAMVKWLKSYSKLIPGHALVVVVFYVDGMSNQARKRFATGIRAIQSKDVRVDILEVFTRSSRDTGAVDWVREVAQVQGVQISYEVATHLIDRTALDGGSLEREVEKIAALKGFNGQVTRNDVDSLDLHPAEQVVWDYLDAITERKTGQALRMLESALTQGEQAQYLMSILAGMLRRLIIAKSFAHKPKPETHVSKALGVPPWLANKIIRQARSLADQDAESMLNALLELDCQNKTGQLQYGGVDAGLAALTVRLCYRAFR